MSDKKTMRLIEDAEDYCKDIVRLLVQLPVNSIMQEQGKALTLADFEAWQKTRLHQLRKLYENQLETNNKPATEQSR